MMEKSVTCWDSDPPETPAEVEEIHHFDARGMRPIYGRGDNFGRHHVFIMDIWVTKSGRLLMRCWSRCSEIDWRSFEITGLGISEIPKSVNYDISDDRWVPRAVRKAYEKWILEEY